MALAAATAVNAAAGVRLGEGTYAIADVLRGWVVPFGCELGVEFCHAVGEACGGDFAGDGYRGGRGVVGGVEVAGEDVSSGEPDVVEGAGSGAFGWAQRDRLLDHGDGGTD